MAGVTLEELVKKVGVAPEALHERCSDDHLRSISLFLDWRSVAPHLGLSETEREEIESDGKKHSGKKLKTLEKWKSKFVFQATYRRLIEVLLTIGRADHAEEVCKLLPKGSFKTGAVVSTQPMLDSKAISETDREANMSATLEVPQVTASLPESTEDEVHGLEEEFDGLVDQAADDIEQSIKKGKTKLSRVKSTITRLPVSLRHHHIKFLAGKLTAINKAETISDLFSILDLYWDFMNCGLLEQLIERFGSLPTRQKLKGYLKRLKEFRVRTTVREFTGRWTRQNPSNLSKFTMEMGEEWLDRNLEAVEEFKTGFSRFCSFENYALPLIESSHNSVILCWALQRSFPMSAEILQPARQFLQDQGVLKVFFKGVCLLDLQAVSSMELEGVTAGGDMPAYQEKYEPQTSEHISSEEDQEMDDQHDLDQDHEQQQTATLAAEQVSSEKDARVDVQHQELQQHAGYELLLLLAILVVVIFSLWLLLMVEQDFNEHETVYLKDHLGVLLDQGVKLQDYLMKTQNERVELEVHLMNVLKEHIELQDRLKKAGNEEKIELHDLEVELQALQMVIVEHVELQDHLKKAMDEHVELQDHLKKAMDEHVELQDRLMRAENEKEHCLLKKAVNESDNLQGTNVQLEIKLQHAEEELQHAEEELKETLESFTRWASYVVVVAVPVPVFLFIFVELPETKRTPVHLEYPNKYKDYDCVTLLSFYE